MQAQAMDSASEKLTIEEWEQLPEHPKCELVDGELVMLAQPALKHQRILLSLGGKFSSYLEGKTCEAYGEPAVRLDKHKDTVFAPDIVVLCDPEKIEGDYIIGAPDLVIEILSPSTAKYDRLLKLNAYKAAGVREYWIVDPLQKTVEVLLWSETSDYSVYDSSDKIKVGIFDDLEIDLKTIFTEG
ncbi:MAG: Uma2 family endonuclease [Oscillospiraceae bacterium]|jgi:Uma2 family endonuclease|nr:Uma2 family endonuclease [Oscillospiraceae bacterium]